MITNSFILLDGVGYRTEERLWKRGFLSWDDFIDAKGISGVSRDVKKRHDHVLMEARDSLLEGSSQFFLDRLRSRDTWRLYPEFREKACYLDIETTGLGLDSEITVVGLYDGIEAKTFVKGDGLSEEVLNKELSGFKLLLTFYGSVFDVPFLKRRFPGLRIEMPHIDLCFASRRIGFRGGLKKIEPLLGIERTSQIKEVNGFEAVRLWNRWDKKGDRDALERLLEYNRADVEGLERLAEAVYQGLWERTFKPSLSSPSPVSPQKGC